MIAYEQRLNNDLRWALQEGSKHFEQTSAVHKTLRRITKKLDELGVSYAIAGDMALFFHGLRRFTDVVDVLVTREGLKTIHEKLEGSGYLPPFQGSKNLRDTDTGVRIEFLVSGDYPGDGKPKPVAFPAPGKNEVAIEGMHFMSIPKLLEMKLASGMTNPGRLKDLGDVQELIVLLRLPREFADNLDPSVRGKFDEMWDAVRERIP